MRIAVLGGGCTSLSAAYYLSGEGHDITIFERESQLGGLAGGFRASHWDWSLERAYHHVFESDSSILTLARETGFGDFTFYTPVTASLYANPKDDEISAYALDTPFDLLRFPRLSLPDRVRAGMVLAFLKFGPFLSLYERQSAAAFLTNTMGERGYTELFGELFRKKFGIYAEKILTSFIWARVRSRTKRLGYPDGGFQSFVDHLETTVQSRGVTIHKETEISNIQTKGSDFLLGTRQRCGKEQGSSSQVFDAVISTLPTPVLAQVGKDIFPSSYRDSLQKIEYLYASNLILETTEPILANAYWLSICTPEIPFMVGVQHTNMIDPCHYGGRHITYVGNYFDASSSLMHMDKDSVLAYFLPHLQRISSCTIEVIESYFFRAPYAQPIFDKAFLSHKPVFKTPVKKLFVANLDMTYPYDRGTNYAIQLGKHVSDMISHF